MIMKELYKANLFNIIQIREPRKTFVESLIVSFLMICFSLYLLVFTHIFPGSLEKFFLVAPPVAAYGALSLWGFARSVHCLAKSATITVNLTERTYVLSTAVLGSANRVTGKLDEIECVRVRLGNPKLGRGGHRVWWIVELVWRNKSCRNFEVISFKRSPWPARSDHALQLASDVANRLSKVLSLRFGEGERPRNR